MPSGVGAPRRRATRAFAGITLIVSGLAAPTLPAGAQAEPTGGINIDKITVGGIAPASFTVTGVDDPQFSATLQAPVIAENTPTPAVPALPPLVPGTYQIQETAPIDETGASVWELTSIDCDGGNPQQMGNGIVHVTVADAVITCTFTNTVTRSRILGQKIVSGDTSSWVRPARFHITCPELDLDMDLEPVGPGGPGTYIIGQGSIPPATCTLSEIDTGSDVPVVVSILVNENGRLLAVGGSSITFTSVVGGNLVLTVLNQFPLLAFEPTPEEPPDPGEQATTTVAGGSTTTTPTTTLVTTTTKPGGVATTTGGGGPATSTAPTNNPDELPTTGRAARGLIVAGLASVIGGMFLVARTRRHAVRVDKRRN